MRIANILMNILIYTVLLVSGFFVGRAEAEQFVLEDSTLQELVTFVSHETGESFVLSGNIEIPVTAYIDDIKRSDYLPFLQRVLDANELSMYKEQGVWVIYAQKIRPEYEEMVIKEFVFNNVEAEFVVPTVTQLIGASVTELDRRGNPKTPVKTSIVLNTASNSILVTANKQSINNIDQVLSSIDRSRKQVVLEAVFVETSLNDSEGYGISVSSPGDDDSDGFFAALTKLVGFTPTASMGLKTGDLNVVVEAVKASDDSRIMSTPRIVTLDGETGFLTVGENVPFLSGFTVDQDGRTIQNIQRVDVGITLNVKPNVISSDLVKLEIDQGASTVSSSTQATDIITNNRQIRTTVNATNGEILRLGGMVANDKKVSESRVPWLSDIPWLGKLFVSQHEQEGSKEITVFIKPILI